MDPVCIDTFADKLKQRVAFRTGVVWADSSENEARLFGFHPAVFVVPALLAAVLWVMPS